MDMILNRRFEEPYSKFAPEGAIPILSKTIVKSRLSPKFWKCTEKIYEKVQNKKSTNDSTNISNENVHKNNNVTKESLLLQIEQLRGIISKLQNEIARKDSIIESQKEDKMKLTKRVEELEKMLSSFLALENPKLSNINK